MSGVIRLEKSNCKNCYKCIRCCPVKSIRFSGNQAYIVEEECILCGQCYVVCPQNAKKIIDGIEMVKTLISSGVPVIASIAPSFIAYFEKTGIESLTNGLKKLGFYFVEETALGATIVKHEYENQIRSQVQDIIISSSCHSVNLLIRKYYPELLKYLSPVASPMIVHSLSIKKRFPNAKTVFIGPCPSKKDEAINSNIEAVLTFEELSMMFKEAKITLCESLDSNENSRARLFPVVGGILKTMDLPNNNYSYMTVDGIENCICALEDIKKGSIEKCFIEMSACLGSCIGGPIMEKYKNSPIRHYQSVTTYAGNKDFCIRDDEKILAWKEHSYIGSVKVIPSENEIIEILNKMDKFKPEDELNCGTCGYNTCREKAIAVFQGKANINMCLPFLMDKTERFSNNIIQNTPNGIIVVNEEIEIQQINKAAMKILNIENENYVMGERIDMVFDPVAFVEVLYEKKAVKDRKEYYPDIKKYLEISIVHDRISHLLIAILRDITELEEARLKKEEVSSQTAQIADKVVDKQMRIVQEIALLLGETAAETKIALTKLKEMITDERE